MKKDKPFKVMTGLGRAYVVNVTVQEVLASFPLIDDPSVPYVNSLAGLPGYKAAKDMCDLLNGKEPVCQG